MTQRGEVKLFVGPRLATGVNALKRLADAMEEIAKAFASIAGSLERMANPIIEVELPPERISDTPCVCGKVKLGPREFMWREPGIPYTVHRSPELGAVCCDRGPDEHLDDMGD